MRLAPSLCAATVLLAVTGNGLAATYAYQNYILRCSGCHGTDRSGLPGRGVPPIRRADLAPFLRTTAGRAFLVQVPGVSESPLHADQIADVLNWLLAGTPSLRKYTSAEVRADRQRRLLDVALARSRIIAQTKAQEAQYRSRQ